MAKNRNKKRNAAVSMDTTEVIVSDIPQGTPSIEKKKVFDFLIYVILFLVLLLK